VEARVRHINNSVERCYIVKIAIALKVELEYLCLTLIVKGLIFKPMSLEISPYN